MTQRDVTYQRLFDCELHWWQYIFESANWGIVISSGDGQRLETMNPYFARMYGYTVEELRGQAITRLFAPSALVAGLQHLATANRESHHSFESTHVRRDGGEFPVFIDVSTVRNEHHEIQYRILRAQDISELKRVEATLAASEQQLRMVVDSQQDMIVFWLPDTTLTFVNQAFCNFHQKPTGELIRRRWLELIADRQQVALRQWLAGWIEQPQPFETVQEAINGRGELRRLVLTSKPILDAGGKLVGVQSTGRDVTDAFRTENALRDSEQRMAAIFNAMFQFMCVLTPAGVLVEVNDTALAFAGLRREETLGRYIWTTYWWCLDWHTQTELQQAIVRAAEGEFVRYEVEVQGREGQRALLDLSLKPVRHYAGEVDMIIAEGREISNHPTRRQGEQEARFSAIASSIPGMVFQLLWSPLRDRATVTYASPGVTELWGVTPEAVVQGQIRLCQSVMAEDRPSYDASFRTSVETLTEWAWYGRVCDAGGNTRWVNVRASPRLLPDGAVLLDGVVLDISRLKANGLHTDPGNVWLHSLAAHLDAVREEERKRMAREVHDELGQLLTALRMEISVLELQTEVISGTLHNRARSMKHLVDDAIGKVRNVATALRPAALDMGLEPALLWLAGEIEQRCGLYCSVQILEHPTALANETATVLFRIVQESLTNVVRHAEASRASIILGKAGNFFILEIRDDGKGFDPDAQQRHDAYGLLGIRERASMLGGHAVIRSRAGQGTTVAVEIPWGELAIGPTS